MTQQQKTIRGFRLSNVSIGMNQKDVEVIAKINLGEKLSVLLADVSAFANTFEVFEQEIITPFDVYKKLVGFNAYYWELGTLYAPNVNDEHRIKDHLATIEYITEHETFPDDWIEKIIIHESEQWAKLELSKWGIKARAEAYARGSIVLGCAVSDERHYHLSITRGLVTAICYENQPLFVAYVPQNRFTFL